MIARTAFVFLAFTVAAASAPMSLVHAQSGAPLVLDPRDPFDAPVALEAPASIDPFASSEPVDIIDEPALTPKKKRKKKVAVIDPQAALAEPGADQPYIEPREPKTVPFKTSEGSGTIVINTAGRELFYVLGGGEAYRYRIAVGKEGFSWTGTKRVSGITDWPDWYPPAEMRARRPELPEFMAGGRRNPLGAKAIYLGGSLYRIHGTNEPRSIGRAASSGCFRMNNRDVVHLASLIDIGTKVVVLKSLRGGAAQKPARKTIAVKSTPGKSAEPKLTEPKPTERRLAEPKKAPLSITVSSSANETPLPSIAQ